MCLTCIVYQTNIPILVMSSWVNHQLSVSLHCKGVKYITIYSNRALCHCKGVKYISIYSNRAYFIVRELNILLYIVTENYASLFLLCL